MPEPTSNLASSSSHQLPPIEYTPIPSLDSFPETGTPKHQKLTSWDFYRSIGSPKRVVAPMVDQSELAWRILSRRYGSDLVYTPMINSKKFVEGSGKARQKFRDLNFNIPLGEEGSDLISLSSVIARGGRPDTDRPLVVQFCGNDPDVLLEAAEVVQDHCDAVDLNLGCPQHIAKRGHYGSFLQEDWPLIFRLINKIHLNLKVPVTAKMRVFDSVERTVAYARMIERAGAQIITVHGRTREMKGHKSGLADWQKIRAVKEAVKVPIFANGNILYPSDFYDSLEATGAEGVMSAEGNLYNAAIFDRAPDQPSRMYPQAPQLPFPSVVEMTREYLEIVSELKTETSSSAIKGHLFKLCRPALEVHRDLRPVLGSCRYDQAKKGSRECVSSFWDFLEELERRIRIDLEEPSYRTPPKVYPPGSLPINLNPKDDGSDEINRPKYIPHWLLQPYFRPSLPPPTPPTDEQESRRLREERVAESKRGIQLVKEAAAAAEKEKKIPTKVEEVEKNQSDVHQQGGSQEGKRAVVMENACEGSEDQAGQSSEPLAKKLKEALDQARRGKERANLEFSKGRHDSALGIYLDSLQQLPPEDEEGGTSQEEGRDPTDPLLPLLHQEIKDLKAILYSNLSACYQHNLDWENSKRVCEISLKLKPDYPKTLNRRARANEELGGLSNLTQALQDYEKLIEHHQDLPGDFIQTLESQKIPELKRRIQEASTREREELMSKLRSIGDGILGRFGLSCDNFKVTRNQDDRPPSGGGGGGGDGASYSFNFVR
ncbi:FMN-linked oxidoreductase [Violaceomyces palustris]|uniref:FMN-linked oxidoreductase n=1 Tax=Violaceomyces palustris TaxID=1673888 RepID=A0ACD0NNW7_9BASI|nr:FMN-linked oxidoreductase [Violaceomyces palustris]